MATEVGAGWAGSGSGRGGLGGLGDGEVEGGGDEVEGGDSEVEGDPRGGGGETGRPRAAAVRMSAASTPAGDDGEVGATAKWGRRQRRVRRGIWGRSGGRRESVFWVKSNLAVACFAKRAIAKIATAVFTRCAAVIAM